jgi:pyridoxine/pyridoxamine 5'-phosphate oxidase
MSGKELVDFIRRHRWGVVGSVSPAGDPQAAVVGVAVTDALEIVFDTLGTSRKARNLRRNTRASLVIGWDEEQTIQIEGIADEPRGVELEGLLLTYFNRFPDGLVRRAWPDITYFRVRPTWVRYSDFRGPEPRIFEATAHELQAG